MPGGRRDGPCLTRHHQSLMITLTSRSGATPSPRKRPGGSADMATRNPTRMAPRREMLSVNPFTPMALMLEELAHVPERLEAIEQQLALLRPSGAKELLTVKEVEEQWGISDTKLYQLINRGEIR